MGLCHGGDTVGFRAMVCAFPEHRRAFFIAFNADVEGADYARIRGLMVEALGVATPAAAAVSAPAPDLADWKGFYVPAPNRFAAFAYVDRVFGVRRVAWRDGALHVRPLQAAAMRLEPMGGRLFREPGRVLASHALLVGTDGARVLVDENQSHARIGIAHIGALWASLLAGVLGIVYVLVVGAWRMLRRRPWHADALRFPWWGVIALAVPGPLFLRQSFLQFGDLTLASASLALVSAMLPIAMLAGLLRHARAPRGVRTTADAVALVAVLQWCAVLATAGLMPARTWML